MLIRRSVLFVALFLIFLPSFSFSMAEKPKKVEQADNLEKSVFQIQREVKQTLDSMIEAYKSRNVASFMKYVAEDYTGERTDLEWSVRKDFSNFNNIELRYSINNITIDSTGKFIQVTLNFNRTYVDIKTGKAVKDSGQSILIFKLFESKPKLYSMRERRLFGISK
ncbi:MULTISPECIES: hypothetical protein [Thermodesulfovibrio]|uniref:hypothetical protein n=1 Tax=Thermodesulfovibrio TaxID=28261 RepID=UPI00261EF9A6|nr:hypothetical protein [Thermodesulfovibrio sp.]